MSGFGDRIERTRGISIIKLIKILIKINIRRTNIVPASVLITIFNNYHLIQVLIPHICQQVSHSQMSLRRILTPSLCRRLIPRQQCNPSSLFVGAQIQRQISGRYNRGTFRFLSTPSDGKGKSNDADSATEASPAEKQEGDSRNKKDVAKFDADEYDDYYEHEEPQTPREKVAYYVKAALRWSFVCALLACLYLSVKELFPGRLGEQSLFSEVFDLLQTKDDIREVIGSPMKAYGREVGRSEGRRNHVDSYKYTGRDGSERVRVRFVIEGPRGKMRVWAEVSNKMPSTEFVYIICRTQTGRVITIVDNRDTIDVEIDFAATGGNGGNNDGMTSAIKALLGGSGGK